MSQQPIPFFCVQECLAPKDRFLFILHFARDDIPKLLMSSDSTWNELGFTPHGFPCILFVPLAGETWGCFTSFLIELALQGQLSLEASIGPRNPVGWWIRAVPLLMLAGFYPHIQGKSLWVELEMWGVWLKNCRRKSLSLGRSVCTKQNLDIHNFGICHFTAFFAGP